MQDGVKPNFGDRVCYHQRLDETSDRRATHKHHQFEDKEIRKSPKYLIPILTKKYSILFQYFNNI
jgi:hypothetical protein